METPSQLSHAIQEVCHCLLIVCLSLKDPTMDSTGVLCLGGRGGHIVPTLSVDLGDVGVVCHVDIIGTAWGDLGSLVDSAPTGSAAASFVQLWVV